MGRHDGRLRGERRRHGGAPRFPGDVGDIAPDVAALAGPLAQREELLDPLMAPGATRSHGAGQRALDEEPDEYPHLL